MPVGCIIAAGTINDCMKAVELLEGLSAIMLLADRGYDTDSILEYAESRNMKAVIPPKKNRKIQREYDNKIHKLRHRVENAFLN